MQEIKQVTKVVPYIQMAENLLSVSFLLKILLDIQSLTKSDINSAVNSRYLDFSDIE